MSSSALGKRSRRSESFAIRAILEADTYFRNRYLELCDELRKGACRRPLIFIPPGCAHTTVLRPSLTGHLTRSKQETIAQIWPPAKLHPSDNCLTTDISGRPKVVSCWRDGRGHL